MVRLICYNTEYCEGMQGRNLEYLKVWNYVLAPKYLDYKIITALKTYKPDILSLVEIDSGSIRSRLNNQITKFSTNLNLPHIATKSKYGGFKHFNLFKHLPLLRKQNNAIISRYKFKKIEYIYLSEGSKRLVIQVKLTIKNTLITLLLAHLALGGKTRRKQLTELEYIVNNIKGEVILMGDFNTFHGVSELQSLIKNTALSDYSNINSLSKKLTQPSFNPKRRLDYILTSSRIKVKNYSVIPLKLSDHLPLLVDFDIV